MNLTGTTIRTGPFRWSSSSHLVHRAENIVTLAPMDAGRAQ